MVKKIQRIMSVIISMLLLCAVMPANLLAKETTETQNNWSTYENLAKGADITASTYNEAGVTVNYIPEHAVDGDETTYWCANGVPTQWLELDFGKVVDFNHIRMLEWAGILTSSYQITYSEDGTKWDILYTANQEEASVAEGSGLSEFVVRQKASARYLHIEITAFDSPGWPTMFELAVYNITEEVTNPEVIEIPVWDRKDIVLTSSIDYSGTNINPYSDVFVDAVFTHEDGSEIRLPGFWNGSTQWCVRFSPTKTGTWNYAITSNQSNNSGLSKQGKITAVENTSQTMIGQHGFLQISDNNRYFQYADGVPFYWMGDTHWQAMNFESLTQCNYPGCECGNQFQHEVDDRREKGFNVYQTYFSAEDDGTDQPDSSEPVFWEQDELYTLIKPETFTNKIDKMFDYLTSQDMVIALGCGVALFTPQKLGDNFPAFARYMTARYASYPVVWITGQEVDYRTEGDVTFQQWLDIAKLVDDLDGYQHPMTAHMWPDDVRIDTKEILGAQPWHDWWAVQGGHAQMPSKALYQKYWNTNKLFLETELFYEDISCGPTAPFNGYEKSRIGAWKANLCGSCGFTYGATGIWSNCYSTAGNIRMLGDYSSEPWYMGLDKAGSFEMTYMKRFFEYAEFHTLVPRFNDLSYSDFTVEEKLVSSREDGKTYVGYFYNMDTSTGEFRGLNPENRYKAYWYNPLTGNFIDLGLAQVTTEGVYQIPDKPTTADWAILVTDRELGSLGTENPYQDNLIGNSTNLALGVAATASSYNYQGTAETYHPSKAVDGDITTYWCSNGVPVQWLELDFGKIVSFNQIRMLEWAGIQTCSYEITISDDGVNWRTLHSAEQETASVAEETGLSEFIVNQQASARYLHIKYEAFDSPGWPTMFELEVYNRSAGAALENGVLPEYGGKVQKPVINSTGGAVYDAQGILTDTKFALTDGEMATSWIPFASIATQTIIMDLQEEKELTGLILTLENKAYLPEYRIEGSINGTDWTILQDATLRDAQVTTVSGLRRVCESLNGKYRYVKLLWFGAPQKTFTKSIAEMELYALEKKVSEELDHAIAEAERIMENPNTVNSWNVWKTFMDALENARKVSANHNATSEDISKAMEALDAAKRKLININKVWAHSLTLLENIGVNFYTTLTDEIKNNPNAYIEFTCDGKVTRIPVDAGKKGAKTITKDEINYECYKFTCKVNAIQMAKPIIAKLYSGENDINPVDLGSYAVKEYLGDIPVTEKESLKELVKAMLDYGSYAQTYFNYDKNNLPSSPLEISITPIQGIPEREIIKNAGDNIKYRNSSLILHSETKLRICFDIIGQIDFDLLKVNIGTIQKITKNGQDDYYVEIPVSATDLDTVKDVIVEYNGVEQIHIKESVFSYANRALASGSANIGLKKTLKSLYQYHQAAKKYFNETRR